MNTKPGKFLRLTLTLLVATVSLSTSKAQNPSAAQGTPPSQSTAPASLADYLKSQYKLTKTGIEGSNGRKVLEPGTILVLQKGTVLGSPPASMAMCPSTYQNGDLKGPNGFCSAMITGPRFLTMGEKVYFTKLDVNIKNEKVTFTLIECDSCNGVTDGGSFKGVVVFQFPKGYLESADFGQVQDMITQVFQIDNGQGNGQAQGQDSQAQQSPQQPNAPAPPAQPPAKITLGMTVDQVKAALGDPASVAEVGAKVIYVYKDWKITFVNGKVSDVQ